MQGLCSSTDAEALTQELCSSTLFTDAGAELLHLAGVLPTRTELLHKYFSRILVQTVGSVLGAQN